MLAYDKDALESEGETAILTVSGNVFWTDAMSFERYHQQAIREVARQNRRKDD